MKNIKQTIVRVVFILTFITISVLGVKSYQLNKLIKRVDQQIDLDQQMLRSRQKELEKLEQEITQINTPEYIEKIARGKLGMVKKEDIVLREKH
ncbi:MAG: Septum formation initiator [Clostridia bacterium]|jgi:cell division protein DivIC|nr:Septum formation initiator [Clostridia bacterium]